ncbi:TetR family transcriptional regulator [Microbacteriaceae bacterium VKM Ac-2854]|nr:TetR family transcriptional regulator [Microbacteriaceae bacterium VKM Ac-2854]
MTEIPSRERILAAARAEFAAFGFAGARVDRMAAAAGLNKERLYAYYGGKRGLFVAAVADAIQEIGLAVDQEARDLPDLAGRMFDFIAAHPENLRLLTWARMESDEFWAETHALLDEAVDPVATIVSWQADGRADPRWNAHDVFVAVLGLCEIWQVTPFVDASDPEAEARRRELVLHLVSGLR